MNAVAYWYKHRRSIMAVTATVVTLWTLLVYMPFMADPSDATTLQILFGGDPWESEGYRDAFSYRVPASEGRHMMQVPMIGVFTGATFILLVHVIRRQTEPMVAALAMAPTLFGATFVDIIGWPHALQGTDYFTEPVWHPGVWLLIALVLGWSYAEIAVPSLWYRLARPWQDGWLTSLRHAIQENKKFLHNSWWAIILGALAIIPPTIVAGHFDLDIREPKPWYGHQEAVVWLNSFWALGWTCTIPALLAWRGPFARTAFWTVTPFLALAWRAAFIATSGANFWWMAAAWGPVTLAWLWHLATAKPWVPRGETIPVNVVVRLGRRLWHRYVRRPVPSGQAAQ